MASVSTLVSTLRENADIAASEYGDTRIQEWLNAALAQHNRRYSLASLPNNEVDCVVMLAWVKVCYARASKATKYYSVGGVEGSVNKGEIVTNNLSLITTLRDEYVTLCSRMGISPAPEIKVSDFTKFDESLHAMTPHYAHESPTELQLTFSNNTGATVDLAWNETPERGTFMRYRIFYGTVAGLKDMTSVGEEDAQYYGIDLTKGTLLKTYDEIWRNSMRVTGLDETETYHFVVIMEDVNGRFSVSNEVSVGPDLAARVDNSLFYATFTFSGALQPNTEYLQSLTFPDSITVEQLNVQLDTAPSGEALVVGIHDASGGGGNSLSVVVPAGTYVKGVEDQTFTVEQATGIYIRTGSTVGGAANATINIGYRIAEKASVLYGPDGDIQYMVTVEGEPPNDHLVLHQYTNDDPPNLEEYCYVTDDAGVRYRLSATTSGTVKIERES